MRKAVFWGPHWLVRAKIKAGLTYSRFVKISCFDVRIKHYWSPVCWASAAAAAADLTQCIRCGLDSRGSVLPGRYSCSGPLCWSAAGLGGVPHSGSGESTDDSRLIDPSSSTPPWTAGTAGLPAASGSAGSCCVTWTAGRRAKRRGKKVCKCSSIRRILVCKYGKCKKKSHNTESGSLSSVLRLLLRWCWGVSVSSVSPLGPTRTGMAISYWPRLDRKAARGREIKRAWNQNQSLT